MSELIGYLSEVEQLDGELTIPKQLGGSTLGSKTITANGVYNATDDGVDGYDVVTANVPNTYTASDEGKVVDNGALVSQTSATYTLNNTYDTTLINSVTVNVSGGSTPTLETVTKTYTPTTSQQAETITPSSGYDGIGEVDVTVNAIPSQYIIPTGTKSISSNGTGIDVKAYEYADVAVPNTYSAADEGKVVSSGALVAQTAHADVTPTTSDQTIDTTTNNSIKVKGDADLVAANIKKDVEIFGVTGSYEGGGGGREDLCEPLDVDFIDYDGRLLYSYTATDFLELSALPPNPTNEGLVAQGWNWSLADAKEYVQQNGTHVIGQNYTTSDGATHAYIHIPDGLINVPFGVNIQTSVKANTTINWGDGTSTTTDANANTLKLYTHAYDTSGDYEIIISSSSGDFQFGANVLNQHAFSNTNYPTVIYRPYIRKVAIGSNCSRLNRSCFDLYAGLESMSIPTTLTSFDSNGNGTIWQNCVSLKALVIPSGTTKITGYSINSCTNIKYISLPKTLTTSCNLIDAATNRMLRKLAYPSAATTPDRPAYGCTSLTHFAAPGTYTTVQSNYLRDCPLVKRVTIPATVTSVQTFALYPCINMEEIHFLSTTPPSLAGASNMFSTSDRLSIYVPYSADHSILNAYKTATNWSSFASYIEEEPQ